MDTVGFHYNAVLYVAIQSSAVLTLSILTRYFIQHCVDVFSSQQKKTLVKFQSKYIQFFHAFDYELAKYVKLQASSTVVVKEASDQHVQLREIGRLYFKSSYTIKGFTDLY